jgi:hypothetical protein
MLIYVADLLKRQLDWLTGVLDLSSKSGKDSCDGPIDSR